MATSATASDRTHGPADIWRQAVLRAAVLDNPWLPHKPTVKQERALLLDDVREILFGGAAGGGKTLYTESMIPTPTGWKAMGELTPGDEVFAADGKPTEVLAVSEVMTGRPCWRLTFDDGSEVVADDDHRWLTFDAKELQALTRRDPARRAQRRAKRGSRATGRRSATFTAAITARNRACPPPAQALPTGTVRTTAEIAATLPTPKGRTNHAVSLAGCLDLPDANLPIDPYVLGAWLGDGTAGAPYMSSADGEVVAEIRAAGRPVSRCTGGRYAWRLGEPAWAARSSGRPG
jgi:replicative DNA helicase